MGETNLSKEQAYSPENTQTIDFSTMAPKLVQKREDSHFNKWC